MTSAARPNLPDEVLDEGIMWMVRLHSGYADAQAMQSNESTLSNLASLSGVPGGVAHDTLERMQHRQVGRRRLRRPLGAFSSGPVSMKISPCSSLISRGLSLNTTSTALLVLSCNLVPSASITFRRLPTAVL